MATQTIGSIVGGLIGGTIATAAMQKASQLSTKLPEAARPSAPREDPGEFMVKQVEARRGPLPETTHRRAAKGLHWAYGIGWATALGVIAPRLGMSRFGRAAAFGAALGALVWAVGYLGWLPRTGLLPPVREQGASHHASALASHVGYGVLAALPIYGANRLLCDR